MTPEEYIAMVEEENKNLKEKVEKLEEERRRDWLLWQATMEEAYNRIIELEKENKKLKDEFMLKLAEAFLLPPTSNQMAVYKQWNYSKRYDEIKNQMRKEIKEWK